jgi:hypothetical protein
VTSKLRTSISQPPPMAFRSRETIRRLRKGTLSRLVLTRSGLNSLAASSCCNVAIPASNCSINTLRTVAMGSSGSRGTERATYSTHGKSYAGKEEMPRESLEA